MTEKQELVGAIALGVFMSILGIMVFASMVPRFGIETLYFGVLTLALTWVGLTFRWRKTRKR